MLYDQSKAYEIDGALTISDIVSTFGAKSLHFECISDDSLSQRMQAEKIVEETTFKAMNAFEVLMSKGRAFPKKKINSCGKKDGLTRKDEIFNLIIDRFKTVVADFPKSTAENEGSYFVQVLCNALWYITSHHQTVNEASRKKSSVLPIPPTFEQFEGFNEFKRKKLKCDPLSVGQLHSHSQALYSLLLKPVVNSSPAWKKIHDEIKQLADCLSAYKDHLESQNATQKKNRLLDHPVRTISEHATVEHRKKTTFEVRDLYKILDTEVKKSHSNPVFFDEEIHLEEPFPDPGYRYRYFRDLQLSVPVDILRFCPGGSIVTSVCLIQVPESRPPQQMLTDSARLMIALQPRFKEVHSRLQRKAFGLKLANLAKIQPSVVYFIYKEFAMDASAPIHPETQERLRLIFLGERGLLVDLRHLNSGRPTGKFDTFFEKLGEVVEKVTAADDRRQNIAHVSEWISLKEMINQAAEQCPPNNPVPSKSLVRLQFAPRNPYVHSAWNFTSRIQVQYKIQRRQLRVSHPDDHFCAAQLKYLKSKAVDMKGCSDDKAKIPLGEPGVTVSTGVRGKQTIAPTTTTLSAADHARAKHPSLLLLFWTVIFQILLRSHLFGGKLQQS